MSQPLCHLCGRNGPAVVLSRPGVCTKCDTSGDGRLLAQQQANATNAQAALAAQARGNEIASQQRANQQGQMARYDVWQQAEYQRLGKAYEDFVLDASAKVLVAALDAAKKRIEELEASREEEHARAEKWKDLAKRADGYVCAANDAAGALSTERDDLLRENAVLRRKVERLERKAKVSR